MKKILTIILSTILLAFLSGCGKSGESNKDSSTNLTESDKDVNYNTYQKLKTKEEWVASGKSKQEEITKLFQSHNYPIYYVRKTPVPGVDQSNNVYYYPEDLKDLSKTMAKYFMNIHPKMEFYGIYANNGLEVNGEEIFVKYQQGWDDDKNKPYLDYQFIANGKDYKTVNVEDLKLGIEIGKILLGSDFDENKFKSNFESAKSRKETYFVKNIGDLKETFSLRVEQDSTGCGNEYGYYLNYSPKNN